MQKITPFLWFDNQVEEAMNFYASIFKNFEILDVQRQGDAVFYATFRIEGQELMALNGGPHFKFTEAISLFVSCDTQEEVDYYWEKLLEGGAASQCGWLKDKFGLSWQIVPKALGELLGDQDREKAGRVMQAMLQMTKIDIATLQKAAEQR